MTSARDFPALRYANAFSGRPLHDRFFGGYCWNLRLSWIVVETVIQIVAARLAEKYDIPKPLPIPLWPEADPDGRPHRPGRRLTRARDRATCAKLFNYI
jgi:hypothetical protein